jgi:hypothetical protein
LTTPASDSSLTGVYVIDRAVKADPQRQWALPDRVFFAAGACQVLAYAAVRAYGDVGFAAYWIRPAAGFRGNHIVVTDGRLAFDYHGWSQLERLTAHMHHKANRWWPGWSCELIPMEPEALISEARSKAAGIHMREPGQFLHDAMPRAVAFLRSRPPPAGVARAAALAFAEAQYGRKAVA